MVYSLLRSQREDELAWRWFLVLALGMGCTGEKSTDDTGSPSSPCADGTWGDLTSPATAIQVRADGDDSGDGSLDAPVATLDAALTLSRTRSSDKTIFVGPGTYTVTDLTLAEDVGDGTTDHGLTIDACADEVTLNAGDPDSPVLRLSGALDVTLARMTLNGGTRTLFIWKSATARIKKLGIHLGKVAGVVIGGHETLVTATEVDLSDDDTGGDDTGTEGSKGFGIGVSGATLTLSDSHVRGARVAGIFIDGDGRGGDVTLDNVTVEGTSADTDGTYGRGLHAQDAVNLAITDCAFSDNADAGVFVLQTTALSMDGVTVDAVASGTLPDTADTSGDGVVVTSVDGTTDHFDPADFGATLSACSITDPARAGVVFEGVTATADGTTTSGGSYGLVTQGDATLAGADAASATDLSASPLDLNRVALDGAALLPTE